MEFKKLSDVEVVAEPAESANVLIEENGVIKKAPKTAVGGAGGGVTSWNDLTDKPFGEVVTEELCLSETEFQFEGSNISENDGYLGGELQTSDSVVVMFDGVRYELEVDEAGGIGNYGLKNPDHNYSDVPFYIEYRFEYDPVIRHVLTLYIREPETATHTISVIKIAKTFNKIPAEYLPEVDSDESAAPVTFEILTYGDSDTVNLSVSGIDVSVNSIGQLRDVLMDALNSGAHVQGVYYHIENFHPRDAYAISLNGAWNGKLLGLAFYGDGKNVNIDMSKTYSVKITYTAFELYDKDGTLIKTVTKAE